MKRLLCSQCTRPVAACYCHTIRHLRNSWPVSILQHPNETHHALGTARIAALSLADCALFNALTPEQCPVLQQQLEAGQTLLVYPGEGATELSSLQDGALWQEASSMQLDNPVRLLLLDGTWRKTRRMLFDSPLLQTLPKLCVVPDASQQSRYRLRKSPRPGYLSTIETIALVLGTLEHDLHKYQPLLDSQEWIQKQQIEAMGQEVYARNYDD